MGTYADIYPRFTEGSFVLFYAHNDIAQWLAETGLVGLGVFLTGAGILFSRCRRFISIPRGDERALFAGAWAGLAGIALHSGFDWNLHLPANAFLTAVIAGLAVASAPTPPAEVTKSRGSRVVAAGVPIAFALLCVVSATFLCRDACSQSAAKMLRRAIAQPSAALPLQRALEVGERMAPWDPRNSQLAVLMGQASLHAAANQADPMRREAHAAQAEKWFALARTSCAVVRGMPSGTAGEASRMPPPEETR